MAGAPDVPLQRFPLPFPVKPYELPSARAPWRDGDRTVWSQVVYANVEGWRPQAMDLYVPDADGPVPVVVYVHGGAWLGGSHLPAWDDMVDWATLWRRLNDAGIAVASISYRHSAEAPFPACLYDVKAAVRWLRTFGSRLGVDPDRIGLLGDSAGGHLATLAAQPGSAEGDLGAVGVSSAVSAVVGWYPVTSLEDMPGADPQAPHVRLLGGTPAERPELARAASPVAHVGPASP
ncbi:MAG: alpha/beta hydrolase, partial [Nocardioides sp.]|uniref:alpha/beta hydrolase fold domain-containing protein n=1 Tax=Nocardioides sp. TaxID=35761 RepID=UPI0039E59176